MSRVSQNTALDKAEKWVIYALVYHDIFDHPLKAEELSKFTDVQHPKEMRSLLTEMHKDRLITYDGNYCYLPGRDTMVKQRVDESKKVKKYLRIARFMARIIAAFPYVRGVYLSGSLSKERIDEDGDIDFFVITATGRLWIARTLLMLFKKVFLFNSHRYFCLNYFLDESSLYIAKHNRYIATEIATLKPLYNAKLLEHFLSTNSWVKSYYPNYINYTSGQLSGPRKHPVRNAVEWFIDKMGGGEFDQYLRLKTWNFRRRKFAMMDPGEFRAAFATEPHVSRHHPRNFNDSVLEKFDLRLREYEAQHGITLSIHQIEG